MKEIVKVQVPLFPLGGPALIYPKEFAPPPGKMRLAAGVVGHDFSVGDRKQQQALGPKHREALNGDLKGFFEAEFIDGRWKLGKRIEDQGW
jgi:hypothetical protein